MTNETVVEFLEEWQTGFLFLIVCFAGGATGSFLFAGLGWNFVLGFVTGAVFVFLVASYVLYSR